MTGHIHEMPPSEANPFDRPHRQSVLLNAEIYRFGSAGSTRHRVRDLSSSGVRVDNAAGLRAGSTIAISVGMLEGFGATVVWVRDGCAGIAFAKSIDPDRARARAAVAPKATTRTLPTPSEALATAGCLGDLSDPYRARQAGKVRPEVSVRIK